jgi:hypothetical protein
MTTDPIPFPVVTTGTTEGQGPLVEKLLIDASELSRLTSLSLRTLRRMDASRDIPGRVVVGRRVLFQVETIREWVKAGLPGREVWTTLQKRNGKR